MTENRLIEAASEALAQNREALLTAQEHAQTGLRVDRPSAGLTEWAEGARAAAKTAMSGSRGRGLARAKENLSQVDSAFEALGGVLSRVRELAVQQANDTYTAGDRKNASQEVQALFGAALAAANVRGSDGEYLLAGSQGNQPAFDANGAFLGDTLERQLEYSEGQRAPVTVAGSRLTVSSGVEVLGTIRTIANQLDTNDVAGVRDSIDKLQAAIQQVSAARSQVGGRLNAIMTADDARRAFEEQLARTHVRAVETNTFAAATDFARAQTALEAAKLVTQAIIQATRPE